jgi:hypothetical protein
VIQLGEVLQDRNIVFHEKVTHGERAMPADSEIGDGTHIIRKGLDQFRGLVI